MTTLTTAPRKNNTPKPGVYTIRLQLIPPSPSPKARTLSSPSLTS